MARKAVDLNDLLNPLQKVATNQNLVNLGDVNNPYIPEFTRDAWAQNYKTAAENYNTGSFHARHPVASAGFNALIGALTLNPANIVGVPLAGSAKEATRKNEILDNYRKNNVAISEQQKNLQPTQEAATRGFGLSNLAANAGYQSPFGQYDQVSDSTFKNVLDGIMAGDTAQNAIAMQQDGFKKGWNTGGNMVASLNGQRTAPSPSIAPQAGEPYLAASAMDQGTVAPPALRPAIYQNPDIVKAGVDNAAKLFETGLKTVPDYTKLPAQVQEILAKVNLTNAQTATEKQRPAYVQSQTNENNASTALKIRTPGYTPPNPTIASELNKLYEGGAFGQPGTPQAQQAYASILRATGGGGYETTTNYTRDGEGRVISSTSSKTPVKAGSRPTAPKSNIPTFKQVYGK